MAPFSSRSALKMRSGPNMPPDRSRAAERCRLRTSPLTRSRPAANHACSPSMTRTGHEQEKFFDFGPRWRCLKAIHFGENEALAELELHAAFSEDTSVFNLHPALLDLATGSALYLIEDYGQSSAFYFPMFYKRAVIHRRIPSKFFSHIRSRQKNAAGRDVATFDLTLFDRARESACRN